MGSKKDQDVLNASTPSIDLIVERENEEDMVTIV